MFGDVVSTMLFGLAANADNLTVGLAYGINRRWMRWRQNLLIAAVTTAITLLALFAGRQVRAMFSETLSDTIGGMMLISLAMWGLYRERTATANRLGSPVTRASGGRPVGLGETLFLAGSLSINNIGLAIAGGIGGVGYVATAASIFCFSVVMLAVGLAIGTKYAGLRFVPRALRHPLIGNGALALAGAFVLAGY